MPDFAQAWIPYRTMRRTAGAHWRDSEVMADHELSLALPSLRWGLPAYAFFASPRAVEAEGVVQYPPACWWVLTASGARCVVFAQYPVLPFAPGLSLKPVALLASGSSLEERASRLEEIEELMTPVAASFFRGEAGETLLLRELNRLLCGVIAQELQTQYHALAPDFFAWLEAGK